MNTKERRELERVVSHLFSLVVDKIKSGDNVIGENDFISGMSLTKAVLNKTGLTLYIHHRDGRKGTDFFPFISEFDDTARTALKILIKKLFTNTNQFTRRIIMDKTVAKNILEQLGGNKFIAMTGAKNMACDDNNLSFRIMNNFRGITHVKITLNSLDLYDVKFYSIRKSKCDTKSTVIAEVNGIYNNMLRDVFTNNTGLYTHL